jgi:hypothetical protein
MFSLIERFMNNLTKETLNGYAKNANINFSEEELDFAYRFTKKNWQSILANHGIFNIKKYADKFTPENYQIILKLYKENLQKYNHYL